MGGSSRSKSSWCSTSTIEDKEREKQRLGEIVRGFAREVVSGVSVNLVSPSTTNITPAVFLMDRSLLKLRIMPKEGFSSDLTLQEIPLANISNIYKGADVAAKAQSLRAVAHGCLGMETRKDNAQIFLHFDLAQE